jgi:hypothetical protein
MLEAAALRQEIQDARTSLLATYSEVEQ